MKPHLPLPLLTLLLACCAGISLAVPSADSPAWGTDSTFNNADPALEYSVTGNQSVDLKRNTYESAGVHYSTGLYIAAGAAFTINQNTTANGSAFICLDGAFSGSGTLTLVGANGSENWGTRFTMTSAENDFSGKIVLSQKEGNKGGILLRIAGTGLSGATVDLSGSLNQGSDDMGLEIQGSASLAGLDDADGFAGTHKGRLHSSGASAAELTLTGSGIYTYGGSIGSTDPYLQLTNPAAGRPTGRVTVVMDGTGTQILTGSVLNADFVARRGTLDFNNGTLGTGTSLVMNGEGTLSNATVAGATLSYIGGSLVQTSGMTWTSGTVDVSGAMDDFSAQNDGTLTFDLGVELGSGDFTVSGLKDSQYSISGSTLTLNAGVARRVSWLTPDGEAQKTAFILNLDASSGNNVSLGYLNGTLSTSGDKVYQITNTGDTKINLNGVYNSSVPEASLPANTVYRGNIWMDVSAGAFGIIAGGVTNNYGTRRQTSTLTGDTQVQLSGDATAEHLIGGNYQGESTTLTGNTNVTVKDNAIVAGVIIGGSTSAHNAVTTVTGNTSVLVTNIQYSNSAAVNLGQFGNLTVQNFIAGGSAWTSNTGSGAKVQGDTSVTIDLSSVELSETGEHNSFVKNIYGGSYSNTSTNDGGGRQTVEGSSSVAITGKEGVTFTGNILGGSFWNWGNGTTLTTNGNTGVSIDGGSTFTGMIVGGSWRGSTWTAEDPTALPVSIGGDVTVTLGTGTYLGDIYGAGNCGTVGGDVLVSLTGGSVFGAEGEGGGITIGGSAGAAVAGGRTLELKGTFGAADFQYASFTQFDKIDVTGEGSSATIYSLTESARLEKTGAGRLTLGANAAGAEAILGGITEGISITGGSLNLSGADGSHLKGDWSIASGSQLTGVSGTVTVGGENGLDSLSIALGTANIGQDAQAPASAISNGSGTGGNPGLDIAGEGLTLDLSNDAVVNLLLEHKVNGATSYLTLTSGNLTVGDLGDIAFTTDILDIYGIRVTGTDKGSLLLSGEAGGLYRVDATEESDQHTLNNYHILSSYSGVVIGSGQTLTLNLPGTPEAGEGDRINNLMGATGSSLEVNNTGDGTAVVILNNEQMATGDPELDPAGQDTTMGGSITGGTNVAFIKEGNGTLTVGGTMDVENLTLRDGGIVLNGEGNSMDTVALAGGGLTVKGTAGIGTITATEAGGSVTIQGALELTGTSSIAHGAITGTGSLRIRNGAELSLTGEARLDGPAVTVDGTLDFSGTETGAISSLSGTGTLSMNGGSLSIFSATASAGTFGGTLEGSGTLDISGKTVQTLQTGNADYNLAVRDGGFLVLKGTADAPELSYGSITAGNNGTLRLEATGDAQGSANTVITADTLTLQTGSTTEFIYNLNQDAPFGAPMLAADTITVQEGANILLSNMTGNAAMNADEDLDNVVLMTANSLEGLEEGGLLSATVSGLFAVYYKDATLSRSGNDIVLNATVQEENIFSSASVTWNSSAGASLLWNSRRGLDPDSQLAQFMGAVSTMIGSGDQSGASRALAAAAGSTVNALGTAQRDALRDQMGWIRNRTTLMGVNPAYINEDLPYFHMWMEGTGSYSKLDTRGDESGYQLTTWGGTVGMDVDLSDHFTMGAAFTANYGDLTASAADTADGHLDSYYANLFGRYQGKRWAHTLILTGGWNDAKLNRTVNYGEGSYSTQGSTNGWGFGAMYELTYDVYLNEDKSSIFQPLLNASVVRTSMDGYTETGAGNAGLNVGKQEWTTGTVALGGRWMGLVGSNVFGREALAELRVNVAQDMGDERGKTGVGFLANPGYTQTVRGAKVGTTALQIGAGLNVPVGTQGTIFVNGNADIRNGASSLSGSVGYRYDF